MPETVIDKLEVVEVHKQHRHLAAVATGAAESVLQAIQEEGPVGSPES